MPLGRRPGRGEARSQIVAAARASFAELGYERSSLRGIARRARVDPALVHYHFDGKPELFVEALGLTTDPQRIVERVRASVDSGADSPGTVLVSSFLRLWDRHGEGTGFVSLVQAVSESRAAADGLREFLTERVWACDGDEARPEVADMRHSLIASQLFGLGWSRFVLRVEPFASAPAEELASWIGPIIDNYLGDLPARLVAARPASPQEEASPA